jgi:hypothetical protein
MSERFNGPLELVLHSVTLGPAVRRQGRSYGLRTTGLGLSDSAQVLLEDFALSLSEWAKRKLPPFQILFWLGDRERQYALLKAAYLGPGGMGQIAVAQGFLIPEATMEELRGRAHRLLPLIPEPDMTPWEPGTVAVKWDAARGVPWLSPMLDPPPAPEIVARGRFLAMQAPPWQTLDVGAARQADLCRRQLLDAVLWQRTSLKPSWTTSLDLPAIGRFDPDRIALRMTAGEDARVESAANADLPPLLDSQELLLDLFDSSDDLDEEAEPASRAARKAMGIPKSKPEYAHLPPHRAIIDALQDILREGLGSDDFWEVLGLVARNSARLGPGPRRDEAVLAITTFVADSARPDPRTFAELLSHYLEKVWGRLPGRQEHPLIWVLDRDVLGWLEPSHVRLLIEACLNEELAGRLAGLLEAQLARPAGAPGRMQAPATIALIEELGQRYKRHRVGPNSLRVLGAAIGLGGALVEAEPESADADQLVKVGADQLDTLMGKKAQAVPEWGEIAFRFLPGAVRLLRHRRGQEILGLLVADARKQLAPRPSEADFDSSTELYPNVVARLAIVGAFARADLMSLAA